MPKMKEIIDVISIFSVKILSGASRGLSGGNSKFEMEASCEA